MAAIVQPGTEAQKIVTEEEDIHGRVQARAAADVAVDSGSRVGTGDIDRQLIELRDAIGEAKPDDLAPLVEQMTRLAALRSQLGGSESMPIDTASPYFARMVLDEGGRRREVLIGKRSFIDRQSNIQIVDWRNAPVSQIYYRYDEDDDYEVEIAGRTVSGIVALRRNLSIARSILKRIGAPQGTFVRGRDGIWRLATGGATPRLRGGQGSAARAPRAAPQRVVRGGRGRRRRPSRLGIDRDQAPRADKHLPEIAALIDREQFDLIARPSAGIVAVQGGAGSGKTTVALHRIAYLIFADKRYRPRSILFVVPSRALVRYVVDVLPALGVHGVGVHTYGEWARRTRQRLLPGTGGKYTSATPEAVSRVKKHPALEGVLVEYVADQTAAFEAELAQIEGGDPIVDHWSSLSGSALVPRMRKLRFWLGRAQLAARSRVAAESAVRRWLVRTDDIIADWSELMTDESRLARRLSGQPGLRARDVSEAVVWTAEQLEEAATATVEAIDGRGLDDDSHAGRFDPEDDPIILRLIQLKRGGLDDRKGNRIEYQHVAIDEAQDRSAIEIRVLLEAAHAVGGDPSSRSVTLAGDMAQRIVFDNAIESWDELLEHSGLGGTEVNPLRISYRSTAEVMALARQILGADLDPGDPLIARSGAPVEIHELGDVGEAVAFLGDALRTLMIHEPTASAAVLARFPEQADAYYAGLRRSEVPRLRRVRRDDFTFQPGVDVTEVSQVKGLEFDYVILVDVNPASFPTNIESRHLLHIGATRAAHQLWLITAGNPSPLLPDEV